MTKAPARHRDPARPRRVMLVGWDAADWQIARPLMDQGQMPTLTAMTRQGVAGNLASISPMLSPILWNTIATGKRPDQHGVHGFTEPDPNGPGIRPTASTSRTCKALWNIATQAGLRTHVVGWYASHPAEPIAGVMVSNQFEIVTRSPDGSIAPPPPSGVHPASMLERLADLRVAPGEIDASAILPFIPAASEIIASGDTKHLGALQHLLAQTATIHAIATELLATTDWDLACIYYEGIDRFKHQFMDFHPPKLEAVSQSDFERYQHCVCGAYRFHDMMLQTLLTLAGEDTAVVLISDHGYTSDHRRLTPEQAAANPAACHRPFGILAAQGPEIARGAPLFGASLLDIAPTILDLLGLPPALDMPGRVLAEVLTTGEPLARITSWEGIGDPQGQDAGMHPPDLRADPIESREALAQLAALGYIEPPGADDEETVRKTIAINRMTLAQSLFSAGRPRQALETLDALEPPFRDQTDVRTLRASCLLALDQRSEARAQIESLRADHPENRRFDLMLGSLELAEKHHDAALELLDRVARAEPTLPGLHTRLGRVLHEVGRFDRAAEAFTTALTADPDDVTALVGLARARLRLGDPAAALDHAMSAAERTHHLPGAHHIIGAALLELGRPQDAIEALGLALVQAPGYTRAKRDLARALRAVGRDAEATQIETELVASGQRLSPP